MKTVRQESKQARNASCEGGADRVQIHINLLLVMNMQGAAL